MRLLHVEGDPEVNRSAAGFLRRGGYAVDAVPDAAWPRTWEVGIECRHAYSPPPCDGHSHDAR